MFGQVAGENAEDEHGCHTNSQPRVFSNAIEGAKHPARKQTVYRGWEKIALWCGEGFDGRDEAVAATR